MTKKGGEPETLNASIPIFALPVLAIALVIRYPISLVVIIPVVVIALFSSSGKTPSPQAPQSPVAEQTPAAPVQSPAVPPPSPSTVPPPPPAVPVPSPQPAARYTIQVGAFESQARAVTLSRELAIVFSDVSVEPASGAGTLYRVHVGRFVDQSSAQPVMSRLQHEGLSGLIVPLD
jgi:cell division protein FtsN